MAQSRSLPAGQPGNCSDPPAGAVYFRTGREGLGNINREYLSKLDADMIVFQAKSDNVIAASRLGRDRLAALRHVDGIVDAAMIGTSSATLILPEGQVSLKVAMLGVEPGRTGEPKVVEGQQFSTDLASHLNR